MFTSRVGRWLSKMNREGTQIDSKAIIRVCLLHDMGNKERLEDAKVRYKNKPLSVWSNEEKANHLIEGFLGIEKQIMQYCKLKPEDINDVNIKEYIEQLKAYDI